jgi:hypothetical protein
LAPAASRKSRARNPSRLRASPSMRCTSFPRHGQSGALPSAAAWLCPDPSGQATRNLAPSHSRRRGDHPISSRKTRPSGGSSAYPTFMRGRTEPDSSRAPAGIAAMSHLPTAFVSTSTAASSTPARPRKPNLALSGCHRASPISCAGSE